MTNEYGGTCQFCEKWGGARNGGLQSTQGRRTPLKYDGKVKYGTRHYAHFECFLEKKGREGFKNLHQWQQKQFPYKLLEQWGLIEIAAQEPK